MLIKKTCHKAEHTEVFNSFRNINTLFLGFFHLYFIFSHHHLPPVPSSNSTPTPTITTMFVFMSSFFFSSFCFFCSIPPFLLSHSPPPHTHTSQLSACSVWVCVYSACYDISYCWFPLGHVQCLLLTSSPHFPPLCFSSFTIHGISMNLKIWEKRQIFTSTKNYGAHPLFNLFLQ